MPLPTGIQGLWERIEKSDRDDKFAEQANNHTFARRVLMRRRKGKSCQKTYGLKLATK